MKLFISTLILTGLFSCVGHAAEVKFGLSSDNTKVSFVGTKADGKHNGGFEKLNGSATMDGTDVTTLKVTVEIDMSSTFTDTPKLTNHLKSPDFFDVKNNPKSKFVSTRIEKNGESYTVTGKLTLAGKTKEISFPATIEAKDGNLNVSSSFKINRFDFGVKYGKGMIDEDVALTLSVAVKK